jgi:hypothetical protein
MWGFVDIEMIQRALLFILDVLDVVQVKRRDAR